MNPRKKKDANSEEDTISTIVVVLVCIGFLVYVGVQTVVGSLKKKQSGNSITVPAAGPIAPPITSYNCAKHDGDHELCVKAQTSGKGCSWYAGCSKCIVGSHDGKTYEEICK